MLNSNLMGNKIREARMEKNLSQAELAQQISITAQAVGKWERGESLPDIITLNRIADILGVDMNYFSENFSTAPHAQSSDTDQKQGKTAASEVGNKNKSGWNMSSGEWKDADFSGLKNLSERFSSSNIQRCLFIGSDLSGLLMTNNNAENCDFSQSDISNSTIQNANFEKNKLIGCALKRAKFIASNIVYCDFTDSNFSDSEIRTCNFQNNTIQNAVWKSTFFYRSSISNVTFEGSIEDCSFERCSFNKVTFENVTLVNTFFKNNDKLRKVKFIDCRADRLTYEFLKSGKANLEGITMME